MTVRLVSGSYKLELAQYIELQAFSQFASDLGEDTKTTLKRWSASRDAKASNGLAPKLKS